jgi:uncharacterized membrane protein
LELLVLAVITTAAAVLRFHALAAKTFWFDEGVSVAIARLDWHNFLRILWRREANMSLYYLLLHPWLYFGNSEAFVRGLSVVFALLTVPAIYFLGRRLFDSRAGLIAAALLSVNAYHVRYSQEARSYSLMVFLCVLSSFYFLKALEDPSRANRFAYVLTSALAIYAHFFAGLLVLTQRFSLRFLDRERVPDNFNKDWWKVVVAVSPIAIFVATTGAGPLRWIQRPGFNDLLEFALHLTGNNRLLLLAYVLACIPALILVLRRPGRVCWETWRYDLLLLWPVFPVFLTVAVSFARPLFVQRYFIFCLPALFLLGACGMTRLRPSWLIAPVLLVFLALSLQSTFAYYQQDFDLERDDWRAASQYVFTHALAGDAVLFHIAMGRMPYEYYHSLLDPSSTVPVVLYPHHGDRITFLDFVEKPDQADLRRALPRYQRVWFVVSRAGGPSGLDARAFEIAGMLQTGHSKVAKQDFPGIEIFLYSNNEHHGK